MAYWRIHGENGKLFMHAMYVESMQVDDADDTAEKEIDVSVYILFQAIFAQRCTTKKKFSCFIFLNSLAASACFFLTIPPSSLFIAVHDVSIQCHSEYGSKPHK